MENIRAIQELLEQIYSLSDPLASFLENALSKLSPQNWWQHCVINKFNSRYIDRRYQTEPQTLLDFDFSQKIQILLDNWQQLSNQSQEARSKYTESNKSILLYVRDIRNEIAHQDYYAGKNFEQFNKDTDLLRKFALFIETDIETCLLKMHVKEKNRILSHITNKVISPALNCTSLDEKTRESVIDTFKRLESTTRAREIVDFFFSALKGIRGKEVCTKLHAKNLLAFEDIKEEIRYMYFGDQ